MNQPDPDAQFGSDGCTCIPFTRQTNPPRYLNRPTDTVDMISGWERGRDCPHHAPVTQPAADRAALRERITEAVDRLHETGGVYALDAAEVVRIADAVLAVLPEPADRAVVRAETLREAADAIDAETRQVKADGVLEPDKYRPCRDASAQLRRLAGEQPAQDEARTLAQLAEADAGYRDLLVRRGEEMTAGRRAAQDEARPVEPFTPPVHYRGRDGTAYCVHATPIGPDSWRECRDLDNDAPVAAPSAVDAVVAALQAKAQALSVEAEEEMRRDLEEQAQVWHEAAEVARRTGRKAARSARPSGTRQDEAQPVPDPQPVSDEFFQQLATAKVREDEQPAPKARCCAHNDIVYGCCILPIPHDSECFHQRQPIREDDSDEWGDGLCNSEYPGDDNFVGQLCALPDGHFGEHRRDEAISGTSHTALLRWRNGERP